MSEEMVFLDIEKVDPPREADRDAIDPDKIRELGESIRSQGLLQPILCRPMNGRFEVVAGHRRYLAHRLIGEVKIKALVREMTDDQVMEARAVENDQREDLNPIERAKSYKRLRERFGFSNREIARKMGRSPGSVDKYFKLLEIPEEFQDSVAKKKMSIEVALCLHQIDDEQFRVFYFKSAVENGITVEVAQAWVSDWKKSRAGVAYLDEGGDHATVGDQLSLPVFGTCQCCIGPVDLSKMTYVHVCAECKSQILGALKPDKG